MQLSAYLTALVLAVASTGSAHELHYKATFRRYKNEDCTGILEHKKHIHHGPGVEVKQGKCHSWNDDSPFPAYDYNWRPHAFEDQIVSKTCEFQLYDQRGCKGELIQTLDQVNDIIKDYTCQKLGVDEKGNQLYARSVKVVCHQSE